MSVSLSRRRRQYATSTGVGHHDWPLFVPPWTETLIAVHRIIPHVLDDLDLSVVRMKGDHGLKSCSRARRRCLETHVRTGVVDPGYLTRLNGGGCREVVTAFHRVSSAEPCRCGDPLPATGELRIPGHVSMVDVDHTTTTTTTTIDSQGE